MKHRSAWQACKAGDCGEKCRYCGGICFKAKNNPNPAIQSMSKSKINRSMLISMILASSGIIALGDTKKDV